MPTSPPFLVVFDFDNTIVDGNSDTFIYKTAPSGSLPEHVKSRYREGYWTEFMNDTFVYLHSEGVSTAQMLDTLRGMPWTPGFPELLVYLRSNPHLFDAIILSDSNSVFIDEILSTQPCALGTFSAVLTNTGITTPDHPFQITPFHPASQSHACKRCSHNLCKHTALTDFRAQRMQAGTTYQRVVYVGDGGNDLCPALGLRADDVVFPREGFALARLIEKLQSVAESAQQAPFQAGDEVAGVGETQQQDSESTDEPLLVNIKGGDVFCATVVPWENGHQIEQWLQALVKSKGDC